VRKNRNHGDDEEFANYEYGKKPSENESVNPETGEEVAKKPKFDPKDKEKPNFKLSGKLTEEQRTTESGVVLKFSEPGDAKVPKKDKWRIYPFKGKEALDVLYLQTQSCYLFGKDRHVCDVTMDHPSISKQHAVIQFRHVQIQDAETVDGLIKRQTKPYVMDLESTNGTMLNGTKIDAARYIELKEKDILKFGFSTREYVLMREMQ